MLLGVCCGDNLPLQFLKCFNLRVVLQSVKVESSCLC